MTTEITIGPDERVVPIVRDDEGLRVMKQREVIVETARACLGTPFQHQGRVPGHGLDCVGLLDVVAKALGIEHDAVTNYPRLPDGKTLPAECDRILCRLDGPPRTGDVVLFWIRRPGLPQHVGIISDRGVIHTWDGGPRRVVEHRLTEKWSRRIAAVYTFPGVN